MIFLINNLKSFFKNYTHLIIKLLTFYKNVKNFFILLIIKLKIIIINTFLFKQSLQKTFKVLNLFFINVRILFS